MTTDAKTKYPLLFGIDSPEDLRALSVETLPMVADEIRRFMIESVSKTGGHLASSLGAVKAPTTVSAPRIPPPRFRRRSVWPWRITWPEKTTVGTSR